MVTTACSVRWSQSWTGHFERVLHSPLMKCFLKLWMDCSAVLILFIAGSTNCQLQSCCVTYSFSGAIAWLSVILRCGLYPFVSSLVNTLSSSSTMVVSVMFLIGFTKTQLYHSLWQWDNIMPIQKYHWKSSCRIHVYCLLLIVHQCHKTKCNLASPAVSLILGLVAAGDLACVCTIFGSDMLYI